MSCLAITYGINLNNYVTAYEHQNNLKALYIQKYPKNTPPPTSTETFIDVRKVDEFALGMSILQLLMNGKINNAQKDIDTITSDINFLVFKKQLMLQNLLQTGVTGGRIPYEKRTKVELAEAALKRRLKVPKHATKAEIIALLRHRQ